MQLLVTDNAAHSLQSDLALEAASVALTHSRSMALHQRDTNLHTLQTGVRITFAAGWQFR